MYPITESSDLIVYLPDGGTVVLSAPASFFSARICAISSRVECIISRHFLSQCIGGGRHE